MFAKNRDLTPIALRAALAPQGKAEGGCASDCVELDLATCAIGR